MNKRLIHIGVMVLLLFGFRFLPNFGPVTDLGMQIIGVFSGMIYGWIFVDMATPSILGIVALGFTDYGTFDEIFVATFGSQTAVGILVIIMMIALVEVRGLDTVIVNFLLTRKICQGRPYVIFFMFMLAVFGTSLLCSAVPAAIIMLTIFNKMYKNAGMKPYSKAVAIFFIGIAFVPVMGSVALPVKGAALAYFSIMMNSGMDVSFLNYTVYAFPIAVLLIAAYTLFCKYILRVDLSELTAEGLNLKTEKTTKMQKASLIFTIGMLCLLMGTGFTFIQNPVYQSFNAMGMGGICLAVLALAMLVRIDGEPVMDLRKVREKFDWGTFFLTLSIYMIADAVSSPDAGFREAFAQLLAPISNSLSPYAVVIFALVATTLLTQVMNNAVAGVIMLTIFSSMAGAFDGVNMTALMFMPAFASMFAMFTPMASPICALLFSRNEMVNRSHFMGYGALSAVFLIVIMATVGWGYAELIF